MQQWEFSWSPRSFLVATQTGQWKFETMVITNCSSRSTIHAIKIVMQWCSFKSGPTIVQYICWFFHSGSSMTCKQWWKRCCHRIPGILSFNTLLGPNSVQWNWPIGNLPTGARLLGNASARDSCEYLWVTYRWDAWTYPLRSSLNVSCWMLELLEQVYSLAEVYPGNVSPCNDWFPQRQTCFPNPDLGSAYRLAPRSPVSKSHRGSFGGIAIDIQTKEETKTNK